MLGGKHMHPRRTTPVHATQQATQPNTRPTIIIPIIIYNNTYNKMDGSTFTVYEENGSGRGKGL